MSLTEPTTIIWLHVSEWALLLFGMSLVIGLIGEYKLPFWHPRLEFFEMLVLIGCGGELICDAGVFLFSEHLQTIQQSRVTAVSKLANDASGKAIKALADSKSAHDLAKSASDIATPAKAAADEAKSEAGQAQTLARGARTEADSFKNDIASAKQQAADAESHLADALQRAASAEAELNRLKTPRSLVHADELISALSAFKGTEYTLNVFNSSEAAQFAKVIDAILGASGWVRKQIPLPGGVSTDLFGQGENNQVGLCSGIGIQIHMGGGKSPESFVGKPASELPRPMQVAIFLRHALPSYIVPSDQRNVEQTVQVDLGRDEGIPMRICVGEKP